MMASKQSILSKSLFLLSLFCIVTLSSARGNDRSIDVHNNITNEILKDSDYDCVYTVYVRTSKTWNGGTDSIISVTFYDKTGDGVLIKNLETWGGVMEKGHDYYERGNLDIFTGRGPCLREPVCSMKLVSDGSGAHHGWYCNYVEVTTTGPHAQCGQQLFTVEQWLALDRSPHELTAVRNNCGGGDDQVGRGRTTLLTI